MRWNLTEPLDDERRAQSDGERGDGRDLPVVRIFVSAIATEVLLALKFLTRAAANAACAVARFGAPSHAEQRQHRGACPQQQIAGISRRSAPGHLLDVLGFAVVVVMIVISHVVFLQRI
jgi:hypothetical protein